MVLGFILLGILALLCIGLIYNAICFKIGVTNRLTRFIDWFETL
jgi:hypothetical protein